MSEPAITDSPEWQRLAAHHADLAGVHLRSLFANDPKRGETMTVEAGDLFLDYSKNRITAETVGLLAALAARADLPGRIAAMWRGERINTTENRPVLHVALRMPRGTHLVVDGEDVVEAVHQVLDRMAAFSDQVRSGTWRGATGRPIRNVINIGIGGSDLGPAMAYDALRAFADPSLTVRFVSNVDGTDIHQATRDLDPAETLFVVVQDVHHARDPDQRPHRPGLAGRRARRRGSRRPPLRGRVDQRRQGGRVRHRHRQHVRLLGLGRRPLLVRLGHRPVADDRHRAGRLPGVPRGLPHHRRALPLGAVRSQPAGPPRADRPLVQRLLRGRDGGDPALQPVPGPLPGLPPAARHGVEREVGRPRRPAGAGRHRPDRLGPAGHERPARLLPAHPPGHAADPGRLHRLRPPRLRRSPGPAGAPRPAHGQLLRPDRGPRLRQDGRGGGGRRAWPPSWCRTRRSPAIGRPTRSWPPA